MQPGCSKKKKITDSGVWAMVTNRSSLPRLCGFMGCGAAVLVENKGSWSPWSGSLDSSTSSHASSLLGSYSFLAC